MKYVILILALGIISCNNKKDAEENVDVIDSIPTVQVSDKLLIIPGEKIGNIFIGQNADQLESILGKADLSDAAMGKAWLTWFSKVSTGITGNELNIYTAYRDDDPDLTEKVVHQIRITSDEFKTVKGISTGKTLEQVKQQYPEIELSGTYDHETPNPVSVYDDAESGIAFEMENGICTGIIIHAKDKKVGEEYISFHPDMTPM